MRLSILIILQYSVIMPPTTLRGSQRNLTELNKHRRRKDYCTRNKLKNNILCLMEIKTHYNMNINFNPLTTNI